MAPPVRLMKVILQAFKSDDDTASSCLTRLIGDWFVLLLFYDGY